MAKQFTVSVIFKLLDKMSDPLRKVSRNLDNVDKEVKSLNRSMQELGKTTMKVGNQMRQVGASMTARLTAPIVGMSTAALKFSFDFNTAMANVASLIPNSAARVESLKKTVQDLSIATGISTTVMADGLYQVVSAFGDVEGRSERVLEIAARAATAGVSTVQSSVSLLSAVTKAYGDTSAEATQHVADLAFKTVELGETTFPALARSMGTVTSISRELGLSQEELFASYATLTGVVGDTARTSTQLRGAVKALFKPTDTMKKAFAALGVESGKALVQQKGFVGALKAVKAQTKGSQEAFSKLFPDIEGINAVLALTGAQADTFAEKLAKIQEASGATDKAFKEQTKGINKTGFAWEQFKRKIDVTLQTIGDDLAPVFTGLLDTLTPLLDRFKGMSVENKKLAFVLGLVAAAAGPLVVMLGSMVWAVGAIASAVGTIGIVLVPIVAAFVAWGVAIGQVIANWELLKSIASDFGIENPFKDTIAAIKELQLAWEGFSKSMSGVWQTIKENIPLLELMSRAAGFIGAVPGTVGNAAASAFESKYSGESLLDAMARNSSEDSIIRIFVETDDNSRATVTDQAGPRAVIPTSDTVGG